MKSKGRHEEMRWHQKTRNYEVARAEEEGRKRDRLKRYQLDRQHTVCKRER